MAEYKEINKLNQSLLKKILISPKNFLDAQRKYQEDDDGSAEHFTFGTMVDIMLTGTKQEFDEKFYRIPDSIKCTDTVKAIVIGVYKEIKEDIVPVTEISNYKDVILKHCKYQDYQPKWKDDTRVDKIIEQGGKYFDILTESEGKITVTETEYSNAVSCVMALKSDKFIRPFVDKKYDTEVEFLDKFIVEFNMDGIEIKGELDRVVVNHKTKIITPIDFKTTGKSINSFQSDFWYYRYDFQAATYRVGLAQHSFIQDLLAKNYLINYFHYIAVEKDLKNLPMIFVVGSEIDKIGFSGGELPNGKLLEGLTQSITRYKYAEENNAWDYPMEYYLNGGYLMLET
jgi:hypothetical protein